MIAIDTNILVRYAVKDDKRQTALATAYIADNVCLRCDQKGFATMDGRMSRKASQVATNRSVILLK